ncbi:hypothetical protein VitviT2T_000065 [Vitis vinifera]|uniref:Glycoside hydrolase family 3 N-terminal domain-containing protein n=1 Tax=Vitis vinifera TaxID=29760 RepID=A0ABY9BBG2_VITVI|nr:hypothetical protein VitviT2T_000065 [Vitis vinifera]
MGKVSAILVGLLLLCVLGEAVQNLEIYKDPTQPIYMRIKDLMGRMSLAEKIGQMTQIDRSVATPEIMKEFSIGSLLSGGGSVPLPQATAEDWIHMVNDFQKGSLSSRLGIPMIYGIDAVHGHNSVYKATIFPHNVGLGATRDPELVKRIGAATALEVRATGIQYAFAPCIAVCRDPRWGRCYESYSEDPKIVKAMTTIITGLQGEIPTNSRAGMPYVGGNAISAAIDPSTELVYRENPDAEFVKSGNFSYAIVVVGEHPYAETAGDNSNLTIPEPGPSTITNVCGGIKCVVVVISGRPLVIQPYLPSISALVAAWLPGSEGQGEATSLFFLNFSVIAPATAIAPPWSQSPSEDSVSFLSIFRVLSALRISVSKQVSYESNLHNKDQEPPLNPFSLFSHG